MLRIELFNLNWEAALWRYYLLMAIAIVAGFSGQYWIGFFCLPVFISAMVGMKITVNRREEVANTAKIVDMTKPTLPTKKVAI